MHPHTATCSTAPNPSSLQGGLRHCHMTYGSKSRLLAKVGSDAATCPTALEPASLMRWAPTLSRVQRLQTPPPY
jgi:hypothetical protein